MHQPEWIDPVDAEARLERQVRFDPDLWIVEVEDRNGEPAIDLAQ